MIISAIDRKIMRECPESLTAQRLCLYIAICKLKREIDNVITAVVTPILTKIVTSLSKH